LYGRKLGEGKRASGGRSLRGRPSGGEKRRVDMW